jgi:hypothetical protein
VNILITSARAPISVDIARVLIEQGHRVWLADSLRWPIGRFCNNIVGYVRLPSPRFKFDNFAASIIAFCQNQQIDFIVPTSEEVFWLAKIKNMPAHTKLRTAPLDTLAQLHNKWTFAALANQLGYGAAENDLIQLQDELSTWLLQHKNLHEYVAKPVFSRFATQTIVAPTREQISHIRPTVSQPWLLQQRVIGQEFCTYNLAENGQLVAHCAYLPKYRIGKHSASLYFQPVTSIGLEKLCADFIKATNFTGQICFDVIETTAGFVALECNPRGTSGAHLLAQQPAYYAQALLGGKPIKSNIFTSPMMLTVPLLASYPRLLFSKQGRVDLNAASDVMSQANLPFWAQLASLVEIFYLALSKGIKPLISSTHDIEWNGEDANG